jgi:hypothetical protein
MHIVTEPMSFYLFICLFIDSKGSVAPFAVSVRCRTLRMKIHPVHGFFVTFETPDKGQNLTSEWL